MWYTLIESERRTASTNERAVEAPFLSVTVYVQRSVPEVAALVVHVRDVGERRHLERTLHRLSYTDQLTGLANRRALMRDLLEFRRRADQPGTLLVIDLHGLAEINDAKGRETGDAILIEVGRRVRSLLARAHPNIVAVALAAKLARIAWAVLRSGRRFEMRAAAVS